MSTSTSYTTLSFKTMYNTVVLVLNHGVPVQPRILVYMILNGKGSLTGYGLHGDSLASVFFSCFFLNETFLLCVDNIVLDKQCSQILSTTNQQGMNVMALVINTRTLLSLLLRTFSEHF